LDLERATKAQMHMNNCIELNSMVLPDTIKTLTLNTCPHKSGPEVGH